MVKDLLGVHGTAEGAAALLIQVAATMTATLSSSMTNTGRVSSSMTNTTIPVHSSKYSPQRNSVARPYHSNVKKTK